MASPARLVFDAQSVTCPTRFFEEGTIVQLLVTLINPFAGARPIRTALGCDHVTTNTCTVVILGEKRVTIAVGCEIGCPGLFGADFSLQAPLAAPRHAITKIINSFVSVLVPFVMSRRRGSLSHSIAGAEPRKSAPNTCAESPPSHESMIFA